MKEQWSLSSLNTLGDTTQNSNKIGLSWSRRSVWLVSLCGCGGGGSAQERVRGRAASDDCGDGGGEGCVCEL